MTRLSSRDREKLYAVTRAIRGAWRRVFTPNGAWWFKHRLSSVTLIMALHGCSLEEAEREQAALDHARLVVWRKGY